MAMTFNNILLRGGPGTGKTYWAKAIAYYCCEKELELQDALNECPEDDLDAIEGFFQSTRCEYVQTHGSMDYEDLVYGPEITASGSLTIRYEYKRLVNICNRASKSTKQHCIIIDDVDRADSQSLLGGLLYGFENRGCHFRIGPSSICVPDNLLLVVTGGDVSAVQSNNLLDFLYSIELYPNRNVLYEHYAKVGDGKMTKAIVQLFDDVNRYFGRRASSFSPRPLRELGHGFFLVPATGTPRMILRKIREKFDYQIIPYAQDLIRNGNLECSISELRNYIGMINDGIAASDSVASISKRLEGSNQDIVFSLSDTYDYYKNKLMVAKSSNAERYAGCHRWVLESLIDAILLNGVFPKDVTLTCLLTNTNLGFMESTVRKGEFGSFLLETSKAGLFDYATSNMRSSRGSSSHATYGLAVSSYPGSRYRVTSRYHVEYANGATYDYYPIAGIRPHSNTLRSMRGSNLATSNNAAAALRTIYQLISGYLNLYTNCIKLMPPQYGDEDLLAYIRLEQRYLDFTPEAKRRSPAGAGESVQVGFMYDCLINFHSLWKSAGTSVDVSESRFRALVDGTQAFTLDAFEDLFNPAPNDTLSIVLRKVEKMASTNDYQAVMDEIGIRQMVFQGPPGTSKTFEAKKFVLRQLDPTNNIFTQNSITHMDIARELESYRLDSSDYADPNSQKLDTGGWDLVQFHPSYGYEDFVRGIQVDVSNGAPTYKTVNRVIGEIADFAQRAPKQKFYLIIDEINRANLATVFGELIYGLEYRGSKVSTPYAVKDVNGNTTRTIMLGENLYIIGTMNTADKTIDSLDYAVRRRFIFVDCPPKHDVVVDACQKLTGNGGEDFLEVLLFDAVQYLFEDDEGYFNVDYNREDVKIGHTYFLRTDPKDWLDNCVNRFTFQVIPILREYIKDGIFDSADNHESMGHAPAEIASVTGEERIQLLSESVMHMAQCFNRKSGNEIIDNAYIADYLKKLVEQLGW